MTDLLRKIKRSTFYVVLLILCTGCVPPNKTGESQDVLKIGTLHRIQSENVLYDYTLGIFTMVSNPPLFNTTQPGQTQGFLIESYLVSPDFTTWTFYLGKNFYWSDGVPVTPQDIKFTLEYKGQHVPSRRWIKKTLTGVKIIPPHGVTLTFNKPYSRLDIELSSLRVFPHHIWEKVDNPLYDSPPGKFTGYGPFIIEKIDLNAGMVSLRQNPFWKGKKPGLRGIEIHMYQNPDVLALALEKGYIDTFYQYADSYPYSNLARLSAAGRFNLVENPNGGSIFLGFNLAREPVSHLWFRMAVSYAIDYQEIRKLITSGYGEVPHRGFVPGNMLYFKETPRLERNVDKAREILDRSGYKPANQGSLRLLSTPPFLRICELIKDYLSDIGIPVEVQILDPATWYSMKEQYHYDMTVTNTSPWGMQMHANWGTGYFDARRSGEGVLHTLQDPAFLKLCDDILATRDPAALKTYAGQLQDYYSERLPAVALAWKTLVTPLDKRFSHWHPDPLYGFFNVTNFLDLRRSHAPH